MPVATFGRDLKRLVQIGKFCLVADKDILEVLQELCSLQEWSQYPDPNGYIKPHG